MSHRPPLPPRPAGAPAPATPQPPQRQRVLTTCNISQGRLAPNSTFIVVMVMMLVLSSKCVCTGTTVPPRAGARRTASGGCGGRRGVARWGTGVHGSASADGWRAGGGSVHGATECDRLMEGRKVGARRDRCTVRGESKNIKHGTIISLYRTMRRSRRRRRQAEDAG